MKKNSLAKVEQGEVMCSALLCYLKPEAKRVYSELTENCSVDPDLALAIMENICKDDELFDLSGESDVE